MTYRTTRRATGRPRYFPGKQQFSERRGLIDLGAVGHQQVGSHHTFRFVCCCAVSVNTETGEHYTSILPGCSYGHPFELGGPK